MLQNQKAKTHLFSVFSKFSKTFSLFQIFKLVAYLIFINLNSYPQLALAGNNSDYIHTTFTELKKYNSSCSSSSPRSIYCLSAAHRKCTASFYESGFGPVEMAGENTDIVCIKNNANSLTLNVTYATLLVYHSACTKDNVVSDACFSAVNRHCSALGYTSGFGPVEVGTNDMKITCVNNKSGKSISTNYDELRIFHDDCESFVSAGVSTSCTAAVSRFCRKYGYTSGFGPTDHVGNADANVTCIAPESNVFPYVAAEGQRSIFYDGWNFGKQGLSDYNFQSVDITSSGKNAVRYTRVFNSNKAFGRHLDYESSSGQADRWSVSLVEIDWSSGKFKYKKNIFQTSSSGIAIGTGTEKVISAYDPTYIKIKGLTWVAFECGITGGNNATAATCIGPYDYSSETIDPKKTKVLIEGRDGNSVSKDKYSASVPKLLSFLGHYYLYYTCVKIKADGDWVDLSTRGVEIIEKNGEILIASGSKKSIPAFDSRGESYSDSVKVWNPPQGGSADMSDIVTDGSYIYSVGLWGETDCLTPLDGQNCHYVRVARSTKALGDNIFNSEYATWVETPSSYPTFMIDSAGLLQLYVEMLPWGVPTPSITTH
jgi:hypothetical protein